MLDGVENTAKQTSMNVIIRRVKMDPLATIKSVHMSACALSADKVNIAIKTYMNVYKIHASEMAVVATKLDGICVIAQLNGEETTAKSILTNVR
ncbi:hypothetical protein DPMN_098530 [Dreissena polymorpha]|uniref:Uncharacterized protein n=1 Tax=Dreissena polymorpha TaxID=45954 RepID=A0A9D4LDS5_DREPO|nr:hypothetical protein DPMN_098530 [Dreissena polymorpha]